MCLLVYRDDAGEPRRDVGDVLHVRRRLGGGQVALVPQGLRVSPPSLFLVAYICLVCFSASEPAFLPHEQGPSPLGPVSVRKKGGRPKCNFQRCEVAKCCGLLFQR